MATKKPKATRKREPRRLRPEFVTTEQLAAKLVESARKLSADQKAKVRARLLRPEFSLRVEQTEKQFHREAAKLIREGRMPSLETLCEAILETRKKYANQIRRARREAREEVVVQ